MHIHIYISYTRIWRCPYIVINTHTHMCICVCGVQLLEVCGAWLVHLYIKKIIICYINKPNVPTLCRYAWSVYNLIHLIHSISLRMRCRTTVRRKTKQKRRRKVTKNRRGIMCRLSICIIYTYRRSAWSSSNK